MTRRLSRPVSVTVPFWDSAKAPEPAAAPKPRRDFEPAPAPVVAVVGGVVYRGETLPVSWAWWVCARSEGKEVE
jgi:hypothetical protein